MTSPPQGYLRPSDVAKKWGVTPEAVRRMIRTGVLPAVQTPTGKYLIREEDAELRPARPRDHE